MGTVDVNALGSRVQEEPVTVGGVGSAVFSSYPCGLC